MRHVDDVDAAVGGELGHAVGQGGGGAAGAEGAGAGGDELGAGRLAVHGAAEHGVGGGDAGDVRAVGTGDDADVDEVEVSVGAPSGARLRSRRTSTVKGMASTTPVAGVVLAEHALVEALAVRAACASRR